MISRGRMLLLQLEVKLAKVSSHFYSVLAVSRYLILY